MEDREQNKQQYQPVILKQDALTMSFLLYYSGSGSLAPEITFDFYFWFIGPIIVFCRFFLTTLSRFPLFVYLYLFALSTFGPLAPYFSSLIFLIGQR